MEKKATILLIDDREDMLETLQDILQENGYEIITAKTGETAIAIAKEQFFNIALIDIKLPDISGIEVLKTFRRTYPARMNIMVTGFATLQNSVEALNLGANAYILKPVNLEKLDQLIKDCLKKQREAVKISTERLEKFIGQHRDLLSEMANIGAGNVSSLLSELLDREVSISVSIFDVVSSKNVSQVIKVADKLVVVQHALIRGEVEGIVLLIFPRKSAFLLVDLLTKRKGSKTEWLSKKDQMILKKMGQSLVKCYSDAIKKFVNVSLYPEKLRIYPALGETIMELTDVLLDKQISQVFYINTKINIEPDIKGEFFFLLDEKLSTFLVEKAANLLSG